VTLAAIVRALGGDLHAGGLRANVPAPGHSSQDRSVSLLLDGDRVVIHGFGAVGWRDVRDDLRRRGLVDGEGRLLGAHVVTAQAPPRVPLRARVDAARRFWEAAGPLEGSPAARHLALRRAPAADALDLRCHPALPAAAYRGAGPCFPALLAAIRTAEGEISGVEVTYLTPSGGRARLRTPRKVLGCVPPGSAVRLAAPGRMLLVAEGVATALSASARFGRPAWALLSTSNLRRWTPPPGVAAVLVAADRGADGERSARVLARRLRAGGWRTAVRWPPPPYGDWNEAAQPDREGGGGALGGEPCGWVVRTGGSETDP
jgi:hypothetical protein